MKIDDENKLLSSNEAEKQKKLDQRCYPYVRVNYFWKDTNQYVICTSADGGLEIK